MDFAGDPKLAQTTIRYLKRVEVLYFLKQKILHLDLLRAKLINVIIFFGLKPLIKSILKKLFV